MFGCFHRLSLVSGCALGHSEWQQPSRPARRLKAHGVDIFNRLHHVEHACTFKCSAWVCNWHKHSKSLLYSSHRVCRPLCNPVPRLRSYRIVHMTTSKGDLT